MSEYVFLVGDDYESSNKEYVSIDTDKGKLISIALAASGIPFKGRFDKDRMLFNYDGIYKESVDEIIAKLLRMTEGTLRRRPLDIQLAVCKRYVDNWYCDAYTIQHELKDAMMLITKPEITDSEKEKAVGKD